MMLGALACATAAFLLLGLATEAHGGRRFGTRLAAGHRRLLRRGGWGLMALGFPVAVMARGWTYGPILFAATLMAGAALAFLWLNLWPVRTHRR